MKPVVIPTPEPLRSGVSQTSNQERRPAPRKLQPDSPMVPSTRRRVSMRSACAIPCRPSFFGLRRFTSTMPPIPRP